MKKRALLNRLFLLNSSRLLIRCYATLLLLSLLSLNAKPETLQTTQSETQESPERASGCDCKSNKPVGGVYLAAYRKPSHLDLSSPKVFHNAVDAVIEWLESSGVRLVDDPLRPTARTADFVSLKSLLTAARDSRAAALLLVEVSRPAAIWIRIELKCYDISGQPLWSDRAGYGRGFTSRGAIPKTLNQLKSKLQPQILDLASQTSDPVGSTSNLTFWERQSPSQQTSNPDDVLLPEGTEVRLVLGQRLSWKTSVKGDKVELALAEPLRIGEFTVADRGARALGEIVAGKESQKKPKAGQEHELAIRLELLCSDYGTIRLQPEVVSAVGRRNKGAMVAGGLFFGVPGLLANSGKTIYRVPEGTELTALVAHNVWLPISK